MAVHPLVSGSVLCTGALAQAAGRLLLNFLGGTTLLVLHGALSSCWSGRIAWRDLLRSESGFVQPAGTATLASGQCPGLWATWFRHPLRRDGSVTWEPFASLLHNPLGVAQIAVSIWKWPLNRE